MTTNLLNKIWAPKQIELPNGKTIAKRRSLTPVICLILLWAVVASVQLTGFNFATLTKRGHQFFVILGKMWPPEVSFYETVLPPLVDTIKMSILGSVVGAFLAIPAAMLASHNLMTQRWISDAMKLVLSLVRTIPTLIYASILTLIFGIGTFAGTVAIAIFTFSFMAKQLYELIETVDMAPFEAMEALGANRLYSFFGAIIPQVLPAYIASALYTFEGNVRHAAILGYVGAGGIGILLNEKIAWRQYPETGMILVCLFITVALIEAISRFLRSKLT